MTDVIAHRGPDGDGYYHDGCVAFGHRRLAIIDLSPQGEQPRVTPDRRYAITYNGELYNYRELRQELQSLGHNFVSVTDTEVVLQAYVAWGPACLDRFNGMFAFAIWDRDAQTVFLCRDRFGVKPVYYLQVGDCFLFGSEIKSILQHPAYERQVNKQALLEYFTFQNLFTDQTLFADIRLLPAGHSLTIRRGTTAPAEPQCYWDYEFSEPLPTERAEGYAEELERLFRQAVNRQLVSDAPLGSYLSGGIDSGAIAAVAAQQIPYMKSFTVGFDLNSASGIELDFDERERAEHMSYLFRTEQYEMVLKAGDMERCISSLVWHLEDLRVGQSYPNYYAAQLASKFVKVVLAGTGGDELFGGYPWRYYRAVVNDSFDTYIDKYYQYWQRLIPNQTIKRAFQPIWPEVSEVWTRDIFRDVFRRRNLQEVGPEDYINHSLYFEAKTFLHGLLVVEDKLAMAHGLEARVPFLDNDLVDFATRLPTDQKLGNLSEVVRLNENDPGHKSQRYFQKTKDGKLLLREVLGRFVPREISEGVKQGFSAPDASWFRGESIDYVREMLTSSRTRIYDYLDREAIGSLLDEHFNGETNRRLLIWSLICFENFLAAFFDPDPAASG